MCRYAGNGGRGCNHKDPNSPKRAAAWICSASLAPCYEIVSRIYRSLSFSIQAPTRDSSGTFRAVNPHLCCMLETSFSTLSAFTSASDSNRRLPYFLMIGLRLGFKIANSGIGSAHLSSTHRKAGTHLPLLQPHGILHVNLYRREFPARAHTHLFS